jgi:uncharacterized protein (DUF1684 family)
MLAAMACNSRVTYEEEIAAWRAEKDRYMRSSDSPVPPEQRDTFVALKYFPISADYRVPASLNVSARPVRGGQDPPELVEGRADVIEMSTSSGQPRRMRRIGVLGFSVQGKSLTLTAFVDVGDTDARRLFVPFGDLTNGTETYQGGRYLDLDRTATGIYDLDFNRAYHPFCLFNPSYECPIPPRENRLKIPIRAGERMPSL